MKVFIVLVMSLAVFRAEEVEPVNDKFVGERLKVLIDAIHDVDDPNGKCKHTREYEVQYQYQHDDHEFIFYKIFQCLNADLKAINQRVLFKYDGEDQEYSKLPASCPPPLVSDPEKPDPCKNGFKVGEAVSNTVAKVLVPKLLKDQPENPLANDPTFKELQELIEKEKKETDKKKLKDLIERKKDLINRFEQLVEGEAKKVEECFFTDIVEIKEMNITFVCAKEGAYKTIAEALKNAVGNQVTCGHIDCEGIQEELLNDMENHSTAVTVPLHNDAEPDFNDNIQQPSSEKTYLLVGNEGFSLQANKNAIRGKQCNANNQNQQFGLIKGENDNYTITIPSKNLIVGGAQEGAVPLVADQESGDALNQWIKIDNLDGSMTFKNVLYNSLVLYISATNNKLSVGPSGTNAQLEKFYLRHQCL